MRWFNVMMRSLLAAALVIFSGCASQEEVEENDTAENDLSQIVAEFVTGNYQAIESLSDVELEQLVDILQAEGYRPEDFEDGYQDAEDGEAVPPPSGLATCGGYWGYYAYAETIEQRDSSSGLLYQVGPNCYMWAPGSDCGTDYDDYMLSFYFGYHNESANTLKSMLKWTSSSSVVRGLMGNLSGRLYEQSKGGNADNYNAYVCVDDWFGGYLQTFLLRKY